MFKVISSASSSLLSYLEEFEGGEASNKRKCRLLSMMFTACNEIVRVAQAQGEQEMVQEERKVSYQKMVLQPHQSSEKTDIHKLDSIVQRADLIQVLELEMKDQQLDPQNQQAIEQYFLDLSQKMHLFTQLTQLKLKLRCKAQDIALVYPQLNQLALLKNIFIAIVLNDESQDELFNQLPALLATHRNAIQVKLDQANLSSFTLYLNNLKNPQNNQQIQFQDDKLLFSLNYVQKSILPELANIINLILPATNTKQLRINATRFEKK